MELESYQIPESYKSYIEKFETDPEDAIARLETRVEKRSAGAIGYFFLAWLYLRNGNRERAIEAAWRAKVRAPGSRFMERLHYFISHPHAFDAWKPEKTKDELKRKIHEFDRPHPISDLDALINRLASIETRRIRPIPSDDGNQPDLSEKSEDVDDIVTETLAVIHEKQKNYSAAIETYRRLKETNSSREEHYEKQILRLVKLMNEKKGA
jgi:tetratricopeptide (TPR) repeat protein